MDHRKDRHHIENVAEFSEKFDVPIGVDAHELHSIDLIYRVAFMHEELNEFLCAYLQGDLVKQADALLDLEYVLHGTALWMGLGPIWNDLHLEVHRANMTKEKAVSKEASVAGTGRGHQFDVTKPAGWTPPDLLSIILKHNGRES